MAFSKKKKKYLRKVVAARVGRFIRKMAEDVLKCGEVIGNVTKEAFEELFGESAKKFIDIPVAQGGVDAPSDDWVRCHSSKRWL